MDVPFWFISVFLLGYALGLLIALRVLSTPEHLSKDRRRRG
jgi:hypothetical protein